MSADSSLRLQPFYVSGHLFVRTTPGQAASAPRKKAIREQNRKELEQAAASLGISVMALRVIRSSQEQARIKQIEEQNRQREAERQRWEEERERLWRRW